MKLIITLIAAAFPAAAAAQVLTPTLDLVQEISVSAAASGTLIQARAEAARPFVKPPPQDHHQPGHAGHNPGNGYNVPPANPPHPVHPAHPQHPSHPVTPPNVHPVPPPPPYHPPYNPNPGWNPNPYHPPHPYNPPGYYPPTGPGHQTTSPVVHHPVSTSTWATVGAILLVVLLVVILL